MPPIGEIGGVSGPYFARARRQASLFLMGAWIGRVMRVDDPRLHRRRGAGGPPALELVPDAPYLIIVGRSWQACFNRRREWLTTLRRRVICRAPVLGLSHGRRARRCEAMPSRLLGPPCRLEAAGVVSRPVAARPPGSWVATRDRLMHAMGNRARFRGIAPEQPRW
jgi:hypothetical protein